MMLTFEIPEGRSANGITGSSLAVPIPLPVREEPQPEDPQGLLDRPPPVPGVLGRAPGDHHPPRGGQDRSPSLHQEPLRPLEGEERQAQGGDPEGPLPLPGEGGRHRRQSLPQDGREDQRDPPPPPHHPLPRPQAPLQAPLSPEEGPP